MSHFIQCMICHGNVRYYRHTQRIKGRPNISRAKVDVGAENCRALGQKIKHS